MSFSIEFDLAVYEQNALLHASYSFSTDFVVKLETKNDGKIAVVFTPKAGIEPPELVEEVSAAFTNTVLDQQVRLDLERRFGETRDAIVRFAFSPLTTDSAKKKH